MQLIKFGFLFFITLFFLSSSLFAQTVEENYLKAKGYFDQEQYSFAMEYFRQISAQHKQSPYQPYASFYYALAAYKTEQYSTAKSMWLQMTTKNKKWEKMPEVYYWLSELYFLEEDYANGVLYAKKSSLPESKKLMEQSLNDVDSVDTLEKIYYQFPDDEVVASALVTKIVAQPITARNHALLDMVLDKFGFKESDFGMAVVGESVKKDTYKVAVLMPFLFDGLDNPRRTIRNAFVMDLFHGMQEAAAQLNKKGKKIELVAYDTKRDSAVTAGLLSLPEMKSMDLIVGPLFPVPHKLASDFCYQNQINLIHPLSSSSDVIGGNPFSFLFQSSIEARALAAAQIAIDSVENKNAMIFYEDNARDSLSAYTYAQRIMEEGFEVLMIEGVVDTTVRSTYNMLTAKYERVYSEAKADSIRSRNSKRVIKERRSTREKDKIEYYEEFFRIAPDSIGHIYVASSKTLFASNYISAIEIRADSTVIIGRGEWRESETLTLEEMERLGVYFIDPLYEQKNKASYHQFRDAYTKKYRKVPTENAKVGFDMMMLLGEMMIKYGSYFQTGNLEEGFVPGKVYSGVWYDRMNYNQYVPITVMKDSELQIVNEPNDGKGEE
ncbi:ABC transporter substrate-binding protein [Reichenbachiella ulvae]|uniref:ABC-type branched-chain amino acid transport system, substrate-binding protein n=1 Tax=Reichenbachiella ulvae TaxID=2980104 RepID=A0ABT3CPM1_9BACT|nr:hypothetical protein [Reichenbachiella ulvae]MCV9385474.1 hypothetical protein [Reichenbachiella ulvae]